MKLPEKWGGVTKSKGEKEAECKRSTKSSYYHDYTQRENIIITKLNY